MHAAPDKQISLTYPDARSMAKSGKGTGVVGYNVQAVVAAHPRDEGGLISSPNENLNRR